MSRTKEFYAEQISALRELITQGFNRADGTLNIEDVFKELTDTQDGRLFLGQLLQFLFKEIKENPEASLTSGVEEIRFVAKALLNDRKNRPKPRRSKNRLDRSET